jgi:predicted signal transduction protein with EAL and GGDEF domain
LPFDKIKIDRSFIRDLDDDESARNIVRTLLDLCGHMRLDCVAEGVETAAHAAILRELGCPVLQGYHFSRPLGAEQARALANAESSPVAQAG